MLGYQSYVLGNIKLNSLFLCCFCCNKGSGYGNLVTGWTLSDGTGKIFYFL